MMDRLLHRLRSEDGTSLVEVIAAAVILVVIAGAVTSMLNAAQRASGESRTLAIAGDLAQSEIEQLRAKKFSDLVALSTTPVPVEAGGLKFTVARSSGWASEGTRAPTDCTSTDNPPEALRVSVTVSWQDMQRRPVRVDTLVAAPISEETKGDYVAQINDRNGNGVPGVNVALSGPESVSKATQDDTGCVRFPDLMEGEYTVTVSKTGHVDRQHNSPIVKTVAIRGGEVTSDSFDYDHGGHIWVRFMKGVSTLPADAVTVPGAQFKAEGSTITGTQTTTSPQPANSEAKTAKVVWPSTAQYAVYADTCALSDVPAGLFEVKPGITSPARKDLPLPIVRITVPNFPNDPSFTAAVPAIRVRARSACNTAFGNVGGTLRTEANGSKTFVSQPFVVPPGTSEVCAGAAVNGYAQHIKSSAMIGNTPDFLVATGKDVPITNTTLVNGTCP